MMPFLEAHKLVSIQKWPFSAISASVSGVICATYYMYVSAQPLDFLDLAKPGTRLRGLRVATRSKEKLLISDLETVQVSRFYLQMDTSLPT
jgi:hypothetical protein